MKVADLEATAKIEEEEDFDGDDGVEELMESDVLKGIEILEKTRNLLRFLADPDLCKRVNKKEREIMGGIADMIDNHIQATLPNYEEDEDE